MFSISKAFRVLSLVLAAVLVPATAFAGTTGWTAAKQGQTQARVGKVKLKKNPKVAKAGKPSKDKSDKSGHAKKPGAGKIKVLKRKH